MKKKLFTGIVLVTALLVVGPQLQARAASSDAQSALVWGSTLTGSLDPDVSASVPMQFILLNVYDGLFRYEGNPPKIKPWLAQSYKASNDGKKWTIKIKPNVIFHDGSPLTAKDVVYSFRRVLAMGRGPASAFEPILKPANITKIDEHTVQFVLDKTYAPFLATLPLVPIVNKDLVKKHAKNGDWGSGWLSSHDAGSGAYTFDASTYRPQESLDLRRFKKHFYGWSDNSNPVDVVHDRPVQKTSTRIRALVRGDIDVTDSYLPTDQVERVQKAQGVRVAKNQSQRIMVIRMNNEKPPFDNKNFRKCVSYAFNYKGFINIILKGYAVRNAGPLPNTLWGTPKNLKGYTHNLKKAKKYCAMAASQGAPIHRKLKIGVLSGLAQSTEAAQLLQGSMRRLGLHLEVVPSTWTQLSTEATQAKTTPDMWVHWVSAYFVDPENWIGQMYSSQFHGTWKASSWYHNAKVDKLLDKARTIRKRSERASLYKKASRIVVGDAADVWIYNTVSLRGLSNRVKGYKFCPVGAGSEVRWMSLK